jgi:hypothetical protein
MFTHLMGLKQPRFVTGYSSPELDVAIEQGEIDGRTTVADSMLHEKPQWVDKGLMDFHGIIEIPRGRKHSHPRFAKLSDVEAFARSDIDRKLVAIYRTFIGSGNPYILSPGTPKDRVQILQEAMRKTFKDPEFFKDHKNSPAWRPNRKCRRSWSKRSETCPAIRKPWSCSKSSSVPTRYRKGKDQVTFCRREMRLLFAIC